MKIILLQVGKTEASYIKEGLGIYQKRMKKYIAFEEHTIPEAKLKKKRSAAEQKKEEGASILKFIQPGDQLILLDEKGKQFNSVEFATYLQKRFNSAPKRLVFCIGGPYGFSDEVYAKCNGKISLSSMTFTHQMIRLFFTEQIYRAFTILNNEPYHHI